MKRNLLKRALRVLPTQAVEWFSFLGEGEDDAGYSEPKYRNNGFVEGSFQPMEAKTVLQSGLNVSKNYAMFYTNANIQDVKRDSSPDYVIYHNKRYDVVGAVPWMNEDDWKAVTLVEVVYEEQ